MRVPARPGNNARQTTRYERSSLMSAGFIVMTDPEGNEFCLD
jgi:hypothetical protein